MSRAARRLAALPVLGAPVPAPDILRKEFDGVVVLYPFGRVELRRATPADAPRIHALITGYVKEGRLLPRTLGQVYRAIRDFVVAVDGDVIIGCAALRLYSGRLGEVVALAVARDWHGRGVGRQVVEALLAEARELQLTRVFALTLEPVFFERLGFRVTSVAAFPEKVAQDCQGCAKRMSCKEIAVAIDISSQAD